MIKSTHKKDDSTMTKTQKDKNKKYINQRSQDSEKEFHDAGCFYFFKTDKFLKERKLFLEKTGFFILKKYSHVDINTAEDLILAKKLFIK
jgi:N-acylneuraminate cytidylyltransferase